MKGDFTRKTFRKKKHYQKVYMQQGRVQLDSDWNEQMDIIFHRESSSLTDVIGKSGTVLTRDGFKITSQGNDLIIGAGNYYVNGLLCENEEDVKASEQEDLPLEKIFCWDKVPGDHSNRLKNILITRYGVEWLNQESIRFQKDDNKIEVSSEEGYSLSFTLDEENSTVTMKMDDEESYEFLVKKEKNESNVFSKYPALPDQPGIYVIYLDVWERHIIGIDDPEIIESALGGADTATRTKTVWQVKTRKLGNMGDDIDFDCNSRLSIIIEQSDGEMKARSRKIEPSEEPCILTPTGGYRRLTNQLYRVEIHDGGVCGTEKTPTFKWSRDNGSVVAEITNIDANKLIIKETKLDFAPGQWVEVLDDRHELMGIPGSFVKLKDVKEEKFEYNPDTLIGKPITRENFPSYLKPKVRRWDTPEGIEILSLPQNDDYIKLGDEGIEVQFKVGTYNTGDYWLIPARREKADIEWPNDENGPEFLRPDGPVHHYCTLALLTYHEDGSLGVTDCREFFPSISDIPCLYYISGDGQEAQPGSILPFPLIAYAAVGRGQSEDAEVLFEIEEGGGWLLDENNNKYKSLIVESDERIVYCRWRLGFEAPDQRVKAVLLDADGNETRHSLYFNATLDRPALYYVSGDGQEALPGGFLPFPLMASVRIGKMHIEGAEVRFQIQTGDGWLSVSKTREVKEFVLRTDRTGSVRCRWRLGFEAPDQRVKAVLLDADGNETRHSLYFNATLDRPALYYVSGDGQEGLPGSLLPFPLVVGVAISKMQIEEANVRFRVLKGGGLLRGSADAEVGKGKVDLKTNENGLVGCFWSLGVEDPQQVEAILLGADGEETNLRLAFNASFAVAPHFALANTGTIKLYSPETTEFGPFYHWVENIEAPPAILLGLVDQSGVEEKEGPLKPEDVPQPHARRVLYFLNSAKTPEEIVAHAPIGIGIARRILDERKRLGRFESLNQVLGVNLVGRDRFTEIVRALTEPAGDVQPCEYMEDYGLYSFGKGEPRFKVKDVDLKRFSIELENPVEKTLTFRWWAIPAQEQEPQEAIESKPVALGIQYSALVLDPAACYDHYSWEIFNNIGEGLLKYKPGTTELEPGIAESYTVSPDCREYMFSLRNGLYFTDEMPLTASAVKRSIDRVKSLNEKPSWLVSNFVESVEVVDDYTVQFVLKESVPYFPALAATVPYFPVSETYPEDKIAESTVGHHGPYKIKGRNGDRLILEPNPDYYGSPPRSKLFTLAPYPDIVPWILALKQGEIDMAWRIPEMMLKRFLEGLGELNEKYVVQKVPEPAIGEPKIPFMQERFYAIFRHNVKGVVLDPKLMLRYYLIYKEQEPQ